METSILNSTKKLLQLSADDTSFDPDVILHINSALSTLTQLGIGPKAGCQIEGTEENWVDFFGVDPTLNTVKTYVYLKVRLAFDPPQAAAHLEAIKQQIAEAEFRLNVAVEFAEWEALGLTLPTCTSLVNSETLVDTYNHAKE